MGTMNDPFTPLPVEGMANEFAALSRRAVGAKPSALPWSPGAATTARLHGFDAADNALLSDLDAVPGELVVARSTVPLAFSMVGSTAVVLFEKGNPRLPIIVGMIRSACDRAADDAPTARPIATADGERFAITAEREIVLRCGDASITLTRAGKVLIRGNYILSQAAGYNRIKGAAIDIN